MKYPKINYIGNKEKIADWIVNFIPAEVKSVLDAFSGGASISYKLKELGYKVYSNDILKINYLISKSLIENDTVFLNKKDIHIIFSGMPFKGYITKNYKNKYYFENECMELDLYRKNIDKLEGEYKKAMALILLRRAMIRKMPYSRFNIKWEKIKELRNEEYSYQKYGRKRAYHNESFKFHFLENLKSYNDSVFKGLNDCHSLNEDIFSLLDKDIEVDLIYLDPPYASTLNDYYKFYGFLDSYIEQKEIPEFKNNFKSKNEIIELLEELIKKSSKYKYCILSYNDKAYPSSEIIENILKKYFKKIIIKSKKHNYKITGTKNKNSSKELIFICKN